MCAHICGVNSSNNRSRHRFFQYSASYHLPIHPGPSLPNPVREYILLQEQKLQSERLQLHEAVEKYRLCQSDNVHSQACPQAPSPDAVRSHLVEHPLSPVFSLLHSSQFHHVVQNRISSVMLLMTSLIVSYFFIISHLPCQNNSSHKNVSLLMEIFPWLLLSHKVILFRNVHTHQCSAKRQFCTHDIYGFRFAC